MKRIFFTLILFEIILILFLNVFIVRKVEEKNRAFAEESLKKLIIEKRSGLEYIFNQVEFEVENLGLWVSEYLNKNVSENEMSNFFNDYYVNEDGILTNNISSENSKDMHSSNIFLSYNGKLTDKEKRAIINTSKMAKHFESSYKRIPYLQWQYIILDNDMIRMYPISENNINNFEYGHDFKKDIYYLIADELNNPERKAVWTNPYIDYLGRGLVITCSYPIYKSNKMIGIVAIDISLEGIQKSISDLSIQDSGKSFLVDKHGRIIYYPNYVFENSQKGMVVNAKINTVADGENEIKAYDKMLSYNGGMLTYKSSTGEKLLLYETIGGLGWIVGIQVDRKVYMENYGLLNADFHIFVAFSAFLIMCLLTYYYYSLSKPMFKLVGDIEEMGKKYVEEFETHIHTDEIKILNNAFRNLESELDKHIENLYYMNEQLQTIFDNMPGVLLIMNTDYDVILINRKGKDSICYVNRGYKNRKCYEMFFNRTEKCENCPVEKSMVSKSAFISEIQNRSRIFNVGSYPILSANGAIKEILVHSYDKTKDVTRNLELANAEKFALIGQVAASVTHELKNNISVIKGASYLLKDIESDKDIDSKEIKGVLNDLEDSIANAENTIHSLLKFNNVGEETIKINLISVIEQILILEKNNLHKHKVKVEKEYKNEIEMEVNVNSLKFIITNLVANAIDIMRDTGGIITIKIFTNAKKSYAYIEIGDTGPGIDDNMKNKLFEPFVSTKDKGSGLGLWITKNQVEKLEGHIYFESKKNIGTKFIVVLPINKGDVNG